MTASGVSSTSKFASRASLLKCHLQGWENNRGPLWILDLLPKTTMKSTSKTNETEKDSCLQHYGEREHCRLWVTSVQKGKAPHSHTQLPCLLTAAKSLWMQKNRERRLERLEKRAEGTEGLEKIQTKPPPEGGRVTINTKWQNTSQKLEIPSPAIEKTLASGRDQRWQPGRSLTCGGDTEM